MVFTDRWEKDSGTLSISSPAHPYRFRQETRARALAALSRRPLLFRRPSGRESLTVFLDRSFRRNRVLSRKRRPNRDPDAMASLGSKDWKVESADKAMPLFEKPRGIHRVLELREFPGHDPRRVPPRRALEWHSEQSEPHPRSPFLRSTDPLSDRSRLRGERSGWARLTNRAAIQTPPEPTAISASATIAVDDVPPLSFC